MSHSDTAAHAAVQGAATNGATGRGEASENTAQIEHALALFRFLATAQRAGTKPIRRFDKYEDVVWLADVPLHEAVVSPDEADDAEATVDVVLEVGRVRRSDPPPPSAEVRDWLEESDDLTDPKVEPRLLSERRDLKGPRHPEESAEIEVRRVEDHPGVITEFERWLAAWRAWAEVERSLEPVRALYDRLFSIYQQIANRGDDLELVLAWGCLGWQPPGRHDTVRRHLLTAPAAIDLLDQAGGKLQVRMSQGERDGLSVEDDMLDAYVIAAPDRFTEVQRQARDLGSGFGQAELVDLSQRLAYSLDASGQYSDAGRPPAATQTAVVAHAPALVLRKRSQQGLIRALDAIAEQLEESGEVPEGLMPLVDPDCEPDAGRSWADEPGGLVNVDDADFLPLPVNDRQLDIIRSVDAKPQTLVQGPPGTGKTHTAAALIAHLLAKGKRVLVTAATDQALKEVRGKLPEEIQPLSVSVLGGGREEMADLKTAVHTITSRSHDHDDRQSEEKIEGHIAAVEHLRAERARCYQQLVTSREAELQTFDGADGQTRTLAEIARDSDLEREQYGWILDLAAPAPGSVPPLSGPELARLRELRSDPELAATDEEAQSVLIDPDEHTDEADSSADVAYFPPGRFAGLVETERRAMEDDAAFADVHSHNTFDAFVRADQGQRGRLRAGFSRVIAEIEVLAERDEAWMDAALDDVRRGRGEPWRERHDQLQKLYVEAQSRLDRLVDAQGLLRTVRVSGDFAAAEGLVPVATNLRQHVADRGKLKTDAVGQPKVGALSPKVVKGATGFFGTVTVDGVPPITVAAIEAFLVWVEGERFLLAMDKAWPAGVAAPAEGSQSDRARWHGSQLKQLKRVAQLVEDMATLDDVGAQVGIPALPWHDGVALSEFGRAASAADTREVLAEAQGELARAAGRLELVAQEPQAGATVRQLHAALQSRDPATYQVAWDRILHLHEMRVLIEERDGLAVPLWKVAPGLGEALAAEPGDPVWDVRIDHFEAAWQWAATCAWLAEQGHADANELLRKIDAAESEVHLRVEHIAALRAWRHALSEERMSGRARANLQQYAQLTKRLGRGTGKYAVQQQREVRDAMERCRSSVPVWIMPLYRVVEQLDMRPNMFDVVIVDEASQAGMEATFLQYLAPKIVVIGDDKQVSPSGVGINQQELRDLAKRYLANDDYIASWQDPKHSFFDAARLRYGDLITLTEHRRCVPEIIGFSNSIAYEPEGIRLVPVRQYGADRLDPVKPVYVPGGYVKGSAKGVNRVEADAIVDQIEKCLADPAYEGKTFGVISMVSSSYQARDIEHKLLERVGPEVFQEREIRCGHPADFQGSERDVIFLSLVAATGPDRKLGALTADSYTQRYNVAVSRAKDQVWLFHSMRQSEILNPECMRYRILDYFYGAANRGTETGTAGRASHDTLEVPFDSLFEQRVHNVLYDRGYTVIPQYEVGSYRIDLVVLGARNKVAIECDGDYWHGPERYRADLARQRDLERCGWTFFRVRESFFYADQSEAMAPLWDLLAEIEIGPSDSAPAADPSELVQRTSVAGPVDLVAAESTAVEAQAAPEPVAVPEPAAVPVAVAVPEPVGVSAPVVVREPVEPVDPVELDEPVERTPGDAGRPVGVRLAPYEQFRGTVIDARDLDKERLIPQVVQIIEMEGPVMGGRIIQAHLAASGGRPVADDEVGKLGRALHTAFIKGLVLATNPLSKVGSMPLTFRVEGQPEAWVRELGPRAVDQVPPGELADVMTLAAAQVGWGSEDALYDEVMRLYGRQGVTDDVRRVLREIRFSDLLVDPPL